MKTVLDIETVPLLSSMGAEYPMALRNPPSNYKSDEAIAKWRANDHAEWSNGLAKESSLNPRLGRIFCIAIKQGTSPAQCFMAVTEAEEKEVLEKFWHAVAITEGEVVTWNGAWDLRFILIRSLVHGIQFTEFVSGMTTRNWLRKYVNFPHTDCKAVLTNWDAPRSGEGLNEWCKLFGIAGKTDGITGGDVYKMYLDCRFQEIAEYNIKDVEATAAIYAAIAPMVAP